MSKSTEVLITEAIAEARKQLGDEDPVRRAVAVGGLRTLEEMQKSGLQVIYVDMDDNAYPEEEEDDEDIIEDEDEFDDDEDAEDDETDDD